MILKNKKYPVFYFLYSIRFIRTVIWKIVTFYCDTLGGITERLQKTARGEAQSFAVTPKHCNGQMNDNDTNRYSSKHGKDEKHINSLAR
jgi:hypothetical protein